MTARLEFDAAIEPAPRSDRGMVVRLPAEAAEVFGTRAMFPVRATFDGVPYRGSTMPLGDGTFCLVVVAAVRRQAGVDLGDTVHVTVERDDEPREVAVPEDLAVALAAAGHAERFAALAFSHRKELVDWVEEAKRPETRARRIERAVAMVAEGTRRS